MQLTGKQLIGGKAEAVGVQTFQAHNPADQTVLNPRFYEATVAEAGMALRLAHEAFDAFRSRSPEDRARLLDTIADEIMALGDAARAIGCQRDPHTALPCSFEGIVCQGYHAGLPICEHRARPVQRGHAIHDSHWLLCPNHNVEQVHRRR